MMVNIEEASFLYIDPKNEDDSRVGEFWVELKTQGCGCCSSNSCDLESKENTLLILDKWIKKKERELVVLREKYEHIKMVK